MPDSPRAGLHLSWYSHPSGSGRLVVVTGAFDVLHVGHLRFLQSARATGDLLLVGVESDNRVAAWKGPGRPVNTGVERAEMLAALRTVDGVFLVQGDPDVKDPEAYVDLLRPLDPAVLAFTQGDPFAEEKHRSAGLLDAVAVEVPLVPERSTSALLNGRRSVPTAG
ncbi:adenylyltransferase/cytidyltransferase family protein [Cryptosporangium aurantiacum]|uniref:Cytidyltransferase-like domain-containing protein n=1 Tax=Cryptosporangium aurantiacum TaxID=134849 RepID=A0A1M7NP19_9ACTN|nr:adenylyltransferase/cytidyltransferase family protein [Cryptosporangium aurantiacum]SHN05697.1 cytidyltransferase-like domain-containing protein [Cryptosporangium aurantiacum]